jgi:hypothetical protein
MISYSGYLFSPAQCAASIAVSRGYFMGILWNQHHPNQVGRMMMNIRGLVLDDPDHTTHLQTLQFAAPAAHMGSGSENEAV